MHHGHSLSTGENILPPLSDFTVTSRDLRPAMITTMSFSDWIERVGLPDDAWRADPTTAILRVKHPEPTDVKVIQKYYTIEWNADF